MSELPIIRIELERVKYAVASMISDRNDELNAYVLESLNRQLTEEWVMTEIDLAVKECLSKTIKNISNDYGLQQAIYSSLLNVIIPKVKGEVS